MLVRMVHQRKLPGRNVVGQQQARQPAGVRASPSKLEGDFLRVGADLEPADVVALDRVVCCYPLYEPL
jgi:hypothetical protein